MSKRVKIFEPEFEKVQEGRSIREVVKNKKAKLLAQRNVAERTLMTFVNGGEEIILQQRQYSQPFLFLKVCSDSVFRLLFQLMLAYQSYTNHELQPVIFLKLLMMLSSLFLQG